MTRPPRPSAGQLALGLGFAALAVGWPLFAPWISARFGVRALAATLIGVGALSIGAAGAALPAELALGRLDAAGLLALVALALATGERVFLLLLPAWVYAALARIFAASLRGGGSVIERVAFVLQPYAPDFIRPYCRGVTRFWAAVFLANAVAVAALALTAPLDWWSAYTGWVVWLVFLALSAAEFAVRKAHFRNYDDRPLDLLFERFFPSERTEMGRRATEYKSQMRRSLGRPERER
ncbi:MAG: hypothetical protein ACHQ6T_09090 [Myxococcota bacterium]